MDVNSEFIKARSIGISPFQDAANLDIKCSIKLIFSVADVRLLLSGAPKDMYVCIYIIHIWIYTHM